MSNYQKLKEMKMKAEEKSKMETIIASGGKAPERSLDDEASQQQVKPPAEEARVAEGKAKVESGSDAVKGGVSKASATSKKRTSARASASKAKSPSRKKEPRGIEASDSDNSVPPGNINVWVDGRVMEAFEVYLFNQNRENKKRQEPRLTKTAVIEKLLRDMLGM